MVLWLGPPLLVRCMTDMSQEKSPTPPSDMRLLTFLVAGVLFMEFLDGTVITTALPAMAISFGTNAIDLNVGISAYLFALGVFIPISGWMAERFGGRSVFMAAITIFTIASLLCGLAPNLFVFVLMRVLQGFGGAMMVPVGRLIVLSHTPKERIISAIATLVWPALVAPVIGPALGGFITTYAHWRWIFYLNIPLGFIALILSYWIVPSMRSSTVKPFDWVGFLLCGAGTLIFLYGAELLSRASANIALAVVLIAAGCACLTGAFFYLKTAQDPMLDLSAFRIPTFATALRGGSLTRAAIGSAPFLLPLMFQVGFGFDAFRSGLLVMAVFAGNLLMKTVTTPILKRFGFRAILVWNGILGAAWLLGCAFIARDTPTAIILMMLFLGGLTRSLQFTAINTVAFADVAQGEMARANALFSTIFQLSLGAGVAMGAIAVRIGGLAAQAFGMRIQAIDYRIAFALVSLAAFASIVDAVRLKANSGDNIAGRG